MREENAERNSRQAAVNDRSERFFLWVWRLDGLLLLGLALLCIAGALALAFNIGVFASRERPEQQLSEIAGADLSAQDLRLADFRGIAGTQFIYAQLAAPSEYIGSGSRGLGYAHNLLFFDTATKKAHWLLPNNDQTLPSFSFLSSGAARVLDVDPVARTVRSDTPLAARGSVLPNP